MKVQLKTIMAGPQGTFAAGQVVELPEAEARRLIAGGFAISAEIVSLPLGGLTPVQAALPEIEAKTEEEEVGPETIIQPKKPARRNRNRCH